MLLIVFCLFLVEFVIGFMVELFSEGGVFGVW